MSILKLPFDMTRDQFIGPPAAIVELVQYGDFQCENCGVVYSSIKLLQKTLGKHLKFVYRHYPHLTLHPLSLEAAVATEAAALQGKFWTMHDLIFENQKYLVQNSFLAFARKIEMDTTLIADTGAYKKLVYKVINDFESGVESGVTSTPTFFVNGRRYNGLASFEGLYKTCSYAMELNSLLL